MVLRDYFDYWDEFYQIWISSQSQKEYESAFLQLDRGFNLSPFNYPLNIRNSDLNADPSFDYLPEPYWGWTPNSGKDLKYVVVNYNPASGGVNQYIQSENVRKIENYSDYVFKQISGYVNFKNGLTNLIPTQYDTTNWHFIHRSKRLAQSSESVITQDFLSIGSYLGIDLVPWHTKNVSSLNGYLQANFDSIKKWSLNFAIEAAKHVTGHFKNVVIVRTNSSTFSNIFSVEFENGFFEISDQVVGDNEIGNDNFQKINIRGSDVSIYLLWGMRNSLPTTSFLKQIFGIVD